ncbi:MATE family efflux transporter [Corynebacterium anserum]|uniref:MATE family efflux transporter n=1 Tax=Corynebacterium anserum TaxID=2684406 RepID=A0A7G7YNS8_9CORY|nr:MATE family efflux transporter [Corynebacterium anserum]MBC2681740.1 MATE family efflux transporter [Corynebacterium anserum]QNH96148.1 MATE family efflux transporter [Corynebacterium anserum]
MVQETISHQAVRADARSIVSLAGPALVVLAATPLYLLLDTAVVGRLGAEDLAALAAGATVLGTVTTQLTFLSYGTTARAARLFGAGKKSAALYEGVQATWVAVFVGVVLAGVVFAFTPQIMGWLTSNEIVAHKATTWMRVTCASIVPALVTMAGNGWLRGMSNTRLPLYFTLAGVIPMAIAVPIFVHNYGLAGSAYANVLGEWIIGALFLGALCLHWRRAGDGRVMRPDWSVIKPQLQMGRDLVVRSLSFQVAFLSAAAVAGRMGSASLAAHQILLQLWNFLCLLLDSVAIAAQALVGAALGAQSVVAARRVALQVVRFSVAASVVLAVTLAVGAEVFPRWFTPDERVLAAMATPWWMLIVLVVMGGVVFALDGVLLGASDVSFLRNATVCAVVVGFIPVVWLSLIFDWGLSGVWCGLLAFIFVRLLAVWWRYRSDAWAH